MTVNDYRSTQAWQAALDLAPHLVRIAEQLPDGEYAGLSALLRTLAAEVPAAIAADLVTGSHVSLVTVLRTASALEVIERVYPALDTAAARQAADALATRLEAGNFGEPATATPDPTEAHHGVPAHAIHTAEPAADDHDDDADHDHDHDDAPGANALKVTAVDSAPTSAPTSVPVMGDPAPAAPSAPTTVTVTESGDVHPNSPQ